MEALLPPLTLRTRLRAASPARPWRVVGWVVLGVVVAAWAVYLRPAILGGPASYLIVSGHSMEPKLHSGDLAIAFRDQTYRRGEVIAYHIPKNQAGAGALVIHRIVGGSARDGYITRGDNRSYRDPWRLKRNDIVGEMKLHAPRLGMVPVYAHSVFGMAFIAAFVGFLVFRGGSDGDGEQLEAFPEDAKDDDWAAAERAEEDAADTDCVVGDVASADVAHPEHLLFTSSARGYELLRREGEPPVVGSVVEEGERSYRVVKVARSPLPFDECLCAYLEPA